MKNSSGEAEGNADHVLLLGGDAGVARDLREAVAGLEAVDEVLDARAAVHGQGLAERLARVYRHLGFRVGAVEARIRSYLPSWSFPVDSPTWWRVSRSPRGTRKPDL
jgi:hypothetical protein